MKRASTSRFDACLFALCNRQKFRDVLTFQTVILSRVLVKN
jgi:hypothetical protein